MGRERFGTMEDVAMLIGRTQGKAQVTCRIGTIDFELYRMVRQRRQLDEAIEFLTITRHWLHTDIDISQDVQTTERSVGISNSSFGIKHTRKDVAISNQNAIAQIAMLSRPSHVVAWLLQRPCLRLQCRTIALCRQHIVVGNEMHLTDSPRLVIIL